MKKLIVIVFTVVVLSLNSFGQSKLTANTLKTEKDTKTEKANISDIEWIVGVWTGKGLGGEVTEVWNKTGGGEMIGTFSFVKNGKSVFYEFMKFGVENGNLILRLKHFNPDMVGWEEKTKTVDFKFIKKEKNRMFFRGLTFEKIGKNKLNIYLALRNKDKVYSEEVFIFAREK